MQSSIRIVSKYQNTSSYFDLTVIVFLFIINHFFLLCKVFFMYCYLIQIIQFDSIYSQEHSPIFPGISMQCQLFYFEDK